MRAYSTDLRLRVLAACDDGMGTAEAADTFAVRVCLVSLVALFGGNGRAGLIPPARGG